MLNITTGMELDQREKTGDAPFRDDGYAQKKAQL